MEKYIETPKISEIHVPVSRIQDMQGDTDIRNTKMQIMEEINSISTVDYVQMR